MKQEEPLIVSFKQLWPIPPVEGNKLKGCYLFLVNPLIIWKSLIEVVSILNIDLQTAKTVSVPLLITS